MKQVAALGGLVVALAGIVGGVAVAQQQPSKVEAPMVVVPAARLSTGTPTPTVAASPSAVPVVKVAPKVTPAKVAPKPVVKAADPAPVKRATVSSKRTVTTKATTTTRSLTMATDPTPVDPAPVQPQPTEAAAPAVPRPPMPTGLTPNTFTGQARGDAPKVSEGN